MDRTAKGVAARWRSIYSRRNRRSSRIQSCKQSLIIFLCALLYQNGSLRIVLLEQDDSSENLLLKETTQEILNMKASKFTLGTIALVLLSVSGWASDKMKANIQIYNTVNVGSTQLAPGEYQLTWTGSGTNAEATFSHGKKVIATVPAQVTQARSGYSGTALYTDTASNRLTGVELPKVSLSFTSDSSVPANSGN